MLKHYVLILFCCAALLPAMTFAQDDAPKAPGKNGAAPVFCGYCHRPAVEDSGGGEMLCAECLKTAVKDPDKAAGIMKDVREVLNKKFKLATKHKIDYEIGTRKELNLEADGEHLELGWFDPKEIRGKQRYTIRILKGLPLDVFRMVAAHELAHDWMHEELPHLMDKPEIREGFAEFVAWSFSREEGSKRAMEYTERRTDPVYGDGFRRFDNSPSPCYIVGNVFADHQRRHCSPCRNFTTSSSSRAPSCSPGRASRRLRSSRRNCANTARVRPWRIPAGAKCSAPNVSKRR